MRLLIALFGGAVAGAVAWAALIWIVVTFFASGGREGGTAAGAVMIGVAGVIPAAFVGSLICAVVVALREGGPKSRSAPRRNDLSG